MAQAALAGETSPVHWSSEIFQILKDFETKQVAYVPDGGHAELIKRVHQEPSMRAIPLTTEEEGMGVVTGAWLGGARAAVLMQSSGVGNCVNMLSLIRICRIPLLTLVTMRGEWGEFNPWQVPMGMGTPDAFKLMGVEVLRVETAEAVPSVVRAAASMAYLGGTPVAVLLSQKLIGAKVFQSGGDK
jgi:sulfopyruvate decarboxylase alpha subunit